MCKGILKIVDVWFNLDAGNTVNRLGVIFVERKLNIRFPELNLLKAARRPRMKQARRRFGRKFSLSRRLPNLIDGMCQK